MSTPREGVMNAAITQVEARKKGNHGAGVVVTPAFRSPHGQALGRARTISHHPPDGSGPPDFFPATPIRSADLPFLPHLLP
jgi:hypothetical protein